MPIHLEAPSIRHTKAFLAAVQQSRALHRGLVTPPRTAEAYRAYVVRCRKPSQVGRLICLPDGNLAGVVTVSEIVLGSFCSAYLGYYGFSPHTGRGHMTEALRLVIADAFRKHGLHRLEANIQPSNAPSIAVVKRLGFRLEGLSQRYLKISGRWRDHERWAITVEDWQGSSAGRKSLRRRPGE